VRFSGVLAATLAVAGWCGRGFAADLAEAEVKKLGPVPATAAAKLVVSADGLRMAFVDRRDAGLVVVCDGKDGPPWDEVKNLAFSENGQVLGYAARKDRLWCVVVGGRAGPPHAVVQGPALSWDGRQVAYYGSGSDSSGAVYVNGAQVGHRRAEGKLPPAVSRNGRVAFVARATGTYERATEPVKEEGTRPGTWGYSDMTDRRLYMVCDRSRGRLYNDLRRPVFSPDGQHLAYAALLQGQWFIVCDGDHVAGPHEQVSDPVWSAKSQKAVYAAKSGVQWGVVCGGRGYGPHESVDMITASNDGRHVAYAARSGTQWLLVCDGKSGPVFDGIDWIGFSGDDRHLACAVKQRNEQLVVVDGVKGPAHAAVHVPERAVLPAKLRYVVVDGGEARLVEVSWPGSGDWHKTFE
jgi:hypothetical protein